MKKNILIIMVIAGMFFTINSISVLALGGAWLEGQAGADIVPPPQAGADLKAPKAVKLDNPITANNVETLLLNVANLAIFLGTMLAVLAFLWIGFKFIAARGNPTAIKEAQMWFLYAVIGTAILISARVIVQVIQNTLTSSGIVNESLFKK